MKFKFKFHSHLESNGNIQVIILKHISKALLFNRTEVETLSSLEGMTYLCLHFPGFRPVSDHLAY